MVIKMVKKVKFALELKDGIKVRTLKELQEHFDLEKLLDIFLTVNCKNGWKIVIMTKKLKLYSNWIRNNPI